MKISIVGDMHIGARNASMVYAEYHISFFENTLFPAMKEQGITSIIQTGDIFDSRKTINIQVWNEWKKRVFDVMRDSGIKFYTFLGNHDCLFKNVNDINSPILLLNEYENITVFDSCKEHIFDKTKVAFIPWINQTNYDESLTFINKSSAKVAFAHLELSGFEFDRGNVSKEGMAESIFDRFFTVFSGHYHHRSDNGHILYVGTPYQLTWIDHESVKGFHVWDSDSLEHEFIENKRTIFARIEYNGTTDGIDFSKLDGKFLKIIVLKREDETAYEDFIDLVTSCMPLSFQVIENKQSFSGEIEETIDLEDTAAILDGYVDSMVCDLDKDVLKSMLKSLYLESLDIES